MIILTIRTDKPEAEIGLYDGQKQIDYVAWEAHRELSAQIHLKIEKLLKSNGQDYETLEGLAVFEGPGSFTGLRIGISVANALAYSLQIPIAGAKEDDWIKQAVQNLTLGKGKSLVMPYYGQLPKTTNPKK